MKTITIYNDPLNKSMGIKCTAILLKRFDDKGTDLTELVYVENEDGTNSYELVLR